MRLSTFISALSWASFITMLWLLAIGTLKFSGVILAALIVFFVLGMAYTETPASGKPKPPVS